MRTWSASQARSQRATRAHGLRQRLDLVRHLVRRDFRLRYHDSTLGMAWSMLLPLAQLGILVFVFQHVVPLGIEGYPAFVFTALLPWAWFSTCLADAGPLFVGNRDLLCRPAFEPKTLVVVNVLSHFLTFLVSLPILLLVLTLYHRPLTAALIAFPLVVLVQGALALGLGLMVATLNVFYRDVQHIVGVLLALLFYLTPVFYRSEEALERFALVFALNPLTALVESYRAIFFYGTFPAGGPLLFAAAVSVILCILGFRVQARWQHEMVDVI